MDKKIAVKKTVIEIFNALSDRGGFDGWWDNIDWETKNEIEAEIETIIENQLINKKK